MPYCPYCGKQTDSSWSYCIYCKKPLIVNLKQGSNKIMAENSKYEDIKVYNHPNIHSNLKINNSLLDFNSIENAKIDEQIQKIDELIDNKIQQGGTIVSFLFEKENLYYLKKDYTSALRILDDALNNFQEQDDFLSIAIAHNEIGLIQEELGFFDLSIIHFENSIENLKKLNETQKLLKVYNNIANVLYLLRDIEKSYEYYEKALNLAEQENLISEQIKIASNLIEILFIFKSFDRTERIIERNLLYFKQVGDPKGIIITLIKKGKLNYFLGIEKYDVSQKVFNEAIELIDKIESTQNFTSMDKARLQWECFFYLGNIELSRNDYEKAENLFLTSLEFINSSKIEDNDVNESLILEALAKLYESKGDYQRSIEYYRLSEGIYYKFGNDAKQAEIKNIIAHIYLNFTNNDSEAINYFEQALDIYEKTNHMKESADIIQKLGDFYANKEIDELALSYFQKARNYYLELNDEYNVKILTEKINSLTN